jgi:hypothetical protein
MMLFCVAYYVVEMNLFIHHTTVDYITGIYSIVKCFTCIVKYEQKCRQRHSSIILSSLHLPSDYSIPEATMASTEPLDIEVGGGGLPPEPPTDRGVLKPIKETTAMERVAGIVAGIAVATSLAAIIIEQSAIVILAGLLSCAMGPYAYWQQTRLTDIKALQETHEAIQVEVDRLHAENERLSTSIEELSATVGRLEDVQLALDTISKTEGKSISVFSEQVEKNKEILKNMKVCGIFTPGIT